MDKNFTTRVLFSWIFLFFVLIFFILNPLSRGLLCTRSFAGNFTQIQNLQQVEKPSENFLKGPGFLEKAANFLYIIYDYIRRAIVFLLEKTLFKGNPKLADFYGDVASFLASLTAVYLLLLLVSSAKKIIGVVLLLGWALFGVAILLRR